MWKDPEAHILTEINSNSLSSRAGRTLWDELLPAAPGKPGQREGDAQGGEGFKLQLKI